MTCKNIAVNNLIHHTSIYIPHLKRYLINLSDYSDLKMKSFFNHKYKPLVIIKRSI